MRNEYWIETQWKGKAEKEIRKFLLRNCDTLRLTYKPEKGIIQTIFKIKPAENHKFIKVKETLKKFFMKKVINNKLFNDITQRKNSKYEHYFYKLSKKVKYLINKETFFWNVNPHNSNNFYFFEDPTFYKKSEMIASVISHEGNIVLYLTDAEKNQFNKFKIN